MNRSFRGPETLMPSIRPRPQLRSLQTSMRDKEEDLALFLEMRKRDKEKGDLLLFQDSDDLDDHLALQPGNSPLFDVSSTKPVRKAGGEDFLNSDGDRNDYDWLMTPPGTPLFPSLEMESRKTYMSELEAPKGQPDVLKSRLANSQTEHTPTPTPGAKTNLVQRQPRASNGLTSSVSGLRRPSSAGGPVSRPATSGGGSRPTTPGSGSRPATPGSGSRPATPTGRPSLTSSKSSRPSTPTSRGTLSSSKSTVHSSPKPASSTRPIASLTSTKSIIPSRSSSPTRSSTGRTSAPSCGPPTRSSTPSRPTSNARSSTPTRSTARSSTPTAKPTAPVSRPTSRTSTPTRRPSTPSNIASTAEALNRSSSSISSRSGSGPPPKNPGPPSRGTSPIVRSRPWNPSEMPGFSLNAPPNLRTTLPNRPLSASRGRPAAPVRSASVEPPCDGRQRRQSCSPSRGRAPNSGIRSSGGSVPAVNRGYSKVNNDVSPIVKGTQMVERVVNMRRLAPPRQDDKHSPSLSGKSASSPDSSGFGRTLSKKSIDMAIRHMDIRLRPSIPGNLRPLMTKIPASSMYSVRSGPTGSRTASVSDSPLATSSNTSSEQSVSNNNNNNHAIVMEGLGSELDDDLASGRGHASPTSVHCMGHSR